MTIGKYERKFGVVDEIRSLNFSKCSFIFGMDNEELVILIWASTSAVL